MRIFNKKVTTENFYIGTPEAEAEANKNSRIKLHEVFDDYLEVLPNLKTEKFIVTGRKGSGKSAIGRTLHENAKNDANVFADFILWNEINLERIIQMGSEEGVHFEKEQLFKWIILTRMLRLMSNNQAIQDLKEIKLVKNFLKKNSGYVELDQFQIIEEIKRKKFEVEIENLVKYFRARGGKEVELKGQRAHFYSLIPALEITVKNILTNIADKNNSYTLVFDDLDIRFKAEKTGDVDSILNLIRICKYYNNILFADNDINAKIIILLRDDISAVLVRKSADMAKVFSSYSIPLVWYQHDLFKINEDLIKLKQFISKRIKINLERNDISIFNNPWDTFISSDSTDNISTFKYLIDHTFYNPRDLILLFKELPTYKFELPLKFADLNVLIGRYADLIMQEIENALTIYFNESEISKIMSLLKHFSKKEYFNFTDLTKKIDSMELKFTSDFIAKQLYEYSLIGNVELNKYKVIKNVFFKFRTNSEKSRMDTDMELTCHRIVRIFFKNN